MTPELKLVSGVKAAPGDASTNHEANLLFHRNMLMTSRIINKQGVMLPVNLPDLWLLISFHPPPDMLINNTIIRLK